MRGRFDWRSVVVRGTIYFHDPERDVYERGAYDAAVELLRSVDADALTESDLTPQRQVVFRIHADEITARRAAPGSA